MKLAKREIKENLVYLALWLILFIAPVLTAYVRSQQGDQDHFPWHEVFSVWRLYVVYLVLFLVHNYLIAPLLIDKHKKLFYFSFVALMTVSFIIYQCQSEPMGFAHKPMHEGAPPDKMMPSEGHPFDDIVMMENDSLMQAKGDILSRKHPDELQGRGEMRSPDGMFHPNGAPPPHGKPPRGNPDKRFGPIGLIEVFAILVFLLMLGMNLGIKLYFKSDEDAKQMRELEKKSLEQQLAYLKYQINPHFFMNTLNNIHALVDIDPEKSKETILILSRIMRHVLYEGDKSMIPIQRELEFIRNYIELMRIRYTDKVKITMDVPEQLPDLGIPPLLLITFVENAFKHGVSYQQESVIDIKVSIDHERLKFVCRNTKTTESNKEKNQGGVGLANVKQRLELLYGNNFTLDFEDNADTFEVLLLLPHVTSYEGQKHALK